MTKIRIPKVSTKRDIRRRNDLFRTGSQQEDKVQLKELKELLLSILFLAWFSYHSEGKPNLILIVTEDHALSAFGAYQNRFAHLDPTPNLDKLASDGVLFGQAFCSNPMAGPSLASLLTGKHGH